MASLARRHIGTDIPLYHARAFAAEIPRKWLGRFLGVSSECPMADKNVFSPATF